MCPSLGGVISFACSTKIQMRCLQRCSAVRDLYNALVMIRCESDKPKPVILGNRVNGIAVMIERRYFVDDVRAAAQPTRDTLFADNAEVTLGEVEGLDDASRQFCTSSRKASRGSQLMYLARRES